MNPIDELFGPIATFECRRAVQPAGLRWLRMLAGMPAAGITIVTLWIWLLWDRIDPAFLPGELLGGGLIAVEATQVVLALLLSPALIAGVIASEKDRGTLAMLLASRLTSSDIVLGRLVGSFSKVLLLSAAAFPLLVLLAALRQARFYELLSLAGLPVAVAFGAGGMAVAASALSKRGRDALMAIYLVEILLLLGAFFGNQRPELAWLTSFNPFATIYPLVFFASAGPAAMAMLLWMGVGVLGTAIAIWQLRPAYLRQTGGGTRVGRLRRRRTREVSDRPMLWKELRIEGAGALGAVGKWLSRLFILLLVVGGGVVVGGVIWQHAHGEPNLQPDCLVVASILGRSTTYVLWLVQWAIGLRAASVVNTERQRSTWDAILASPLEGREIIYAKAVGSMYALRYLMLAACFAWTAALAAESLTISNYVYSLSLLVAGGAFMSAAGVAVSIGVTNTTRSMATTIGLWMGASITTAFLAGLLSSMIMLLGMFVVWTFTLATNSTQASWGLNGSGWVWGAVYGTTRVALYLTAATLAFGWILARFDTLAGRIGTLPLSQLAKKSFDALTGTQIDEA